MGDMFSTSSETEFRRIEKQEFNVVRNRFSTSPGASWLAHIPQRRDFIVTNDRNATP